ncbi:MAG: hypothetical protein HQ485_15395 [Acidobacteria bacterium]|nr:hypothetical protein [Acidobacteriota bacterium]
MAWGLGFLCNFVALDSDLAWTYGRFEQKRSISRQLEGQSRVLIVGGSGVHYSVDAVQFEREVSRASVNFGLHAGLGLNAILATVEPEIAKGDVVLLIPEYGILADNGIGWLAAAFGASLGRPWIGAVGPQQTVREVLRSGTVSLPSLGRSVIRLLTSIEGRGVTAVDARGSADGLPEGVATPHEPVRDLITPHAMRRIEDFAALTQQRGARLVVALPWLFVTPDDAKSAGAVASMVRQLRQIAPVLADSGDGLRSDPSLFSDSYYHLSIEGRRQRTSALAVQLLDWLSVR